MLCKKLSQLYYDKKKQVMIINSINENANKR